MIVFVFLVLAVLGFVAYAVLLMTWETGKAAVNGVKWIVNDHDRNSEYSTVAIERREFKAMQDARANPESKPDWRKFQLDRKVGGVKENSPSPSPKPMIKEDGLSKAIRESVTLKAKENFPSPLPVTLDSENDTAAQKGWLFPEGMTTQYRSNPRFTWKASDTREEVQESEEWLLRL